MITLYDLSTELDLNELLVIIILISFAFVKFARVIQLKLANRNLIFKIIKIFVFLSLVRF